VQLSIVIVNWNSGPLLRRCLDSISESLAAWPAGSYEVLVADNGSSDDSANTVPVSTPHRLLRLGRNCGFGAACNRAAELAQGDLLLLLNPDGELRTGCAERCIAELQRRDIAVGVCSVALADEQGRIARSCARFPGFGSLLGSASGLNAIWPRLAERQMLEWDHASDRTVDHVIGAFYMMPTALFRRLGGFDERFFMYLEDLDLSLRVRQAGLATRFLAEPSAFHLGGGVSRKVLALRLFYSTRSRVFYAFKHLPHWQALVHLGVTLLVEPVARSMHALVRRSWPDLMATWRGFGWMYRELPSLLGRRVPS
jgi:GT2 family glycosyltransferase